MKKSISVSPIQWFAISHLAESDWKRLRDIDEMEKSLDDENKDAKEKERIQDHLNTLYNQPLRMSLFFKLEPYPAGHQVNPQEKKPLTLQFANYRKRPAPNPPTVSVTPKKSSKHQHNDAPIHEHSERKFQCKVEGCTKSYKNSAGLRLVAWRTLIGVSKHS